jgi:hypothetical protein
MHFYKGRNTTLRPQSTEHNEKTERQFAKIINKTPTSKERNTVLRQTERNTILICKRTTQGWNTILPAPSAPTGRMERLARLLVQVLLLIFKSPIPDGKAT